MSLSFLWFLPPCQPGTLSPTVPLLSPSCGVTLPRFPHIESGSSGPEITGLRVGSVAHCDNNGCRDGLGQLDKEQSKPELAPWEIPGWPEVGVRECLSKREAWAWFGGGTGEGERG